MGTTRKIISRRIDAGTGTICETWAHCDENDHVIGFEYVDHVPQNFKVVERLREQKHKDIKCLSVLPPWVRRQGFAEQWEQKDYRRWAEQNPKFIVHDDRVYRESPKGIIIR